jgi:hypothetical protein
MMVDLIAEELAIWATVGVALLLVAVMIWRGEPMPRIETHHADQRHGPQIHDVLAQVDKEKEQDFDEKTWLANNRYPREEPVKAVAEDQEPGARRGGLTKGLSDGEAKTDAQRP